MLDGVAASPTWRRGAARAASAVSKRLLGGRAPLVGTVVLGLLGPPPDGLMLRECMPASRSAGPSSIAVDSASSARSSRPARASSSCRSAPPRCGRSSDTPRRCAGQGPADHGANRPSREIARVRSPARFALVVQTPALPDRRQHADMVPAAARTDAPELRRRTGGTTSRPRGGATDGWRASGAAVRCGRSSRRHLLAWTFPPRPA
jgi:hypothetical protein